MYITRNQWLSLLALALSLLAAGGATLTQIFGTSLAGKIAAGAGFLSSFVNGAIVILSGQGQQVKDVQSMDGVERIRINEQANTTLAALAVDPANTKIMPTPEAQAAITATAVSKEPTK